MFARGSITLCLTLVGCMLSLSAAAKDNPPVRLLADDMFPLHYIDHSGTRQGVVSDIVNRIIDEAGVAARAEYAPWPRVVKSALNLRNILIYSLVRTSKREEQFNWVGPIYSVEAPRLYSWTRRGLGAPKDLETLAKYTVCATDDTFFYRKLLDSGHFTEGKNLLENWRTLQGFTKDEKTLDRVTKVLKKLQREDPCDYRLFIPVIMDTYLRAANIASEELTEAPLPNLPFGKVSHFQLAASKDFDAQLLKRLQRAHRKLHQSGELLELCKRRTYLDHEIYCQQLRPAS